MLSMTEIETNDNSISTSRGLHFMGVPVIDGDGKLIEGERKLKDGTTVRFHNGLIDGNVYDGNGEVIGNVAAFEYENGGKEYWSKGYPHGYPAVIQGTGIIEEDWENGNIRKIRTFTKSIELN